MLELLDLWEALVAVDEGSGQVELVISRGPQIRLVQPRIINQIKPVIKFLSKLVPWNGIKHLSGDSFWFSQDKTIKGNRLYRFGLSPAVECWQVTRHPKTNIKHGSYPPTK
jgi:hypothetical protein